MFNPRRSMVKIFDKAAPSLMLAARYVWHVEIKNSIAYPSILRPLFARMGASQLRAVDVGANVGIYARFLSYHFRYCDAFEPLPSLAESLRLSASSNCTVHTGAVGEINGSIKLRVPLSKTGEMMHALTSASVNNNFGLFDHAGLVEIEAPVVRLDTVLGDLDDLAFVKIDVEGYEQAVINGATSILSQQRPIFQIEICKEHNPAYGVLIETMQNADYKMFAMCTDHLVAGDHSQIEAQPTSLNRHLKNINDNPIWDYLFVPSECVEDLINF